MFQQIHLKKHHDLHLPLGKMTLVSTVALIPQGRLLALVQIQVPHANLLDHFSVSKSHYGGTLVWSTDRFLCGMFLSCLVQAESYLSDWSEGSSQVGAKVGG
ncbi:hypothetical protein Bca4012_082232 [Brassica carinata]